MHDRRSARTLLRHLLSAALLPAFIVTSLLGCITPPPPAFAPGCTGKRWVGVKTIPGATCPPAVNWNATLVARGPLTTAPVGPPASRDYCLYTWSGPTTTPSAADISALQGTPGVLGLSEDCVIVAPLGAEEEAAASQAVNAWLRDELFQAAGGLSQLPDAGQDLTKIRVAIADTSPTATDDELAVEAADTPIPQGNSHHGYTMAWLAQSLACPGGTADPSCLVDVTTQLALPRIDNDKVDPDNGGFWGTPVEVALAIHAAIDAWKQQEAAGRLVINLSLGWQPGEDSCPAYTAPILSEVPADGLADDDMVFEALIRAACNGALVIAAAGNDPGGSSFDPGPTCPAAWQNVPIPSEEACADYEDLVSPPSVDLPRWPPGDLDLPEKALIYGVGGVDYTGAPLSTTRLGSLGRHAAIAFEGVAGDPEAEALPSALTGSSTSAAVVSGAAATLWAYNPELTGHEIMALLYDTGSPVEAPPVALVNPDIQGPLRRVSLCHALSELCSDPDLGLGCTLPVAQCAEPVASTFQNPMFTEPLRASLESFYQSEAPEIVSAQTTEEPPANLLYQEVKVAPWVKPSPGSLGNCTTCFFSLKDGTLRVSIDPSSDLGQTKSLTHMTLVLEDNAGARQYFVPAPTDDQDISLATGLMPGNKVILSDITPNFAPTRATLVFQVDNNGEPASLVEPILLDAGPLMGAVP